MSNFRRWWASLNSLQKIGVALAAMVVVPVASVQVLALFGGVAQWVFIGVFLLAALGAICTLDIRMFLRAVLVWPLLTLFFHAPR